MRKEQPVGSFPPPRGEGAAAHPSPAAQHHNCDTGSLLGLGILWHREKKHEMHMGFTTLHLLPGSPDWPSYFPSAFMPFANVSPFAHTWGREDVFLQSPCLWWRVSRLAIPEELEHFTLGKTLAKVTSEISSSHFSHNCIQQGSQKQMWAVDASSLIIITHWSL